MTLTISGTLTGRITGSWGRNSIVCCGALLLLALGVREARCQPRRPNILFLFSDDQRADTIGAWGNEHIRTPHLDQLARRGVSFRNNYCFGANSGAVCIPSRAMLFTGKTWFDVRHDLSGQRLLPEILREAGYRTFATGKWHNGRESFVRAFPDARSVFFGGMADHTQVEVVDVRQGVVSAPRVAEKFSSEQFADEAIAFLERQDTSAPFFCYVAFTAPHDPRNPPEAYRQMYYKRPPPAPANFLPQPPFDNGFAKNVRDENLAGYPRRRQEIIDQLCEYYGLITHLDEQIGRILEALDKQRLTEQTIVVFAADSGLALGSHGLLGKQSVYEHSMKCPLIVAPPPASNPGVGGATSWRFTYLFDLFPTICEWAGATIPEGIAGQSLLPLLSGQDKALRDSVFLPFSDLMRAVRDERWKLIVYPQINHRQLFDLASDPEETADLADRPEHAAEVVRLTRMMETWQRQVGDTQPLQVASPRPKEIRFDDFERRPDQWQPAWIVEKYFDPVK